MTPPAGGLAVRRLIPLLVVCAAIFGWWGYDLANTVDEVSTTSDAQAIVTMYEDRHGVLSSDARRELVSNAAQACVWLDREIAYREQEQTYLRGGLVPALWKAMTDGGHISSDAAATTIEAAITVLCPEYDHLLKP